MKPNEEESCAGDHSVDPNWECTLENIQLSQLENLISKFYVAHFPNE